MKSNEKRYKSQNEAKEIKKEVDYGPKNTN